MKLLLAVFLLAPVASAQDLVEQVLQIQRSKCQECHAAGSEDRKARRKYPDALDLAFLLEELVVPGEPEESDFWFLMIDGEMPPEDSDVAALTDAELATYRAWIEAGAPLPGVESADQGDPQAFGRLLSWVGRQHPAAVHFPVALLLSVALLELFLSRSRREHWLHAQRFCLRFGALTAVISAGLGWILARSHIPADELELHRWFGVATATVAVCAALVIPAHAQGRRRGFRLVLLVLTVLVCLTGHFGGYLVFGPDYFRL